MKVSDLGEAGLIELIRDWTSGANPQLIVGPGDDAAVLAATGEREVVISTDAFQEGVHFSRKYLAPDEIGHRAMAATLSDLAAMGSEGLAAFVNLSIPPDTEIDFLRRVYQGMDRIADACGVAIAGGDTVRGPFSLGITVIGTVKPGRAICRDGAREGDVICVTGEFGRSEAGRLLLAGEVPGLPDSLQLDAESAHRLPRPRFDVSRLLTSLERRVVDVDLEGERIIPVRPTAMLDVSDGLAIDLRRLCEASHVGCRIEERLIPVNGAARRLAREEGGRFVDLGLGGGEDFELLFTIGAEDVELVLEHARNEGISITPIGNTVAYRDGLTLVDTHDADCPLPEVGYDHFRVSPPPQSGTEDRPESVDLS